MLSSHLNWTELNSVCSRLKSEEADPVWFGSELQMRWDGMYYLKASLQELRDKRLAVIPRWGDALNVVTNTSRQRLYHGRYRGYNTSRSPWGGADFDIHVHRDRHSAAGKCKANEKVPLLGMHQSFHFVNVCTKLANFYWTFNLHEYGDQ